MSHKATCLNSDRKQKGGSFSSPLQCLAHFFIWHWFHTLFWKPKQGEHSKPYLSFGTEYNESMFMHRPAIEANKQNQEFQAMSCFPLQFT